MSFPLNVYLLALAGAFLASASTLPAWRQLCHRIGLVDDPGHRKIHQTPVTLAGGLAVMTGMAVPLLGAALILSVIPSDTGGQTTGGWLPLIDYGLARRGVQLSSILVGAVGMLGIGLLDDRIELGPGPKFGGQLAIAAMVAHSGVRITLFVDSIVFSYIMTILWILTITNAFNFLDNMNGLCAGVGAIGAWCFAWNAAVSGQYLVGMLGFLMCGALLGFLPYNFPKASSFLGDSGSHLVGYLLAVLAILPHFYNRENPRGLAVLAPLLILAVPLADLASVVVIRWRLGKPFYVGDNNHFSHRLVRAGWSRPGAVLLLWLAAASAGWAAFVVLH